jgi:hypothetical protein
MFLGRGKYTIVLLVRQGSSRTGAPVRPTMRSPHIAIPGGVSASVNIKKIQDDHDAETFSPTLNVLNSFSAPFAN